MSVSALTIAVNVWIQSSIVNSEPNASSGRCQRIEEKKKFPGLGQWDNVSKVEFALDSSSSLLLNTKIIYFHLCSKRKEQFVKFE